MGENDFLGDGVRELKVSGREQGFCDLSHCDHANAA